MTRGDRLWLLALAFGAISFSQARLTDPWQLGLTIAWMLVFTATAFLAPRTPTPPPPGEPSPPVKLVQDQIEAFTTAGFSETQARELMQEAMRTAIKTQGGWQP